MTANSTLKLKPVAFLLGLHFAAPALAIGLGDLSVHSTLGQPLHATVEVLSAPSTLDADCLGLQASNNGLPAPTHVRFRIERKGDNALLHITTLSSINDPLAQFVLTSDCEGRLQREYVLLLDPPTQIEPARLAEPQAGQITATASMPSAAVSSPSRPAETSVSSDPPAATTARASHTHPRRAVPPKPERPTATSASIKPSALATPRASLTQPHRAASPKPKTPTAAPRLVISGKNTLSESGSLPTGLEKDTAPPDQSSPRSTNLTTTELSDENTALNRRLAHLELQLAALHKRNAELEARFAASPLAAPKPAATQASQWPLYLLGLGLLASGGALVAGMRRRRDLQRSEKAATMLWTEPINAMPAQARVDPASALPQLDAMLQDDSLPPPPPLSTPEEHDIVELPLSALAEGTDVKEGILDQAEVYVAHGYTNLAINVLQEYLHVVPAGSPVPWLLLLDLLLREGDEAGYAEASTECRRHFNVNFSAHPMSQDRDDNRGLETYPHILEMLTQAWNTPEIHAIFKNLIYDQRGGVRMGFEPGAYRDILMLRTLAQGKALQIAA